MIRFNVCPLKCYRLVYILHYIFDCIVVVFLRPKLKPIVVGEVFEQYRIEYKYIQEYLGDETDVRFPETVGDMTIEGICARKGAVPPNYEKIETVQLPDRYYWIGAHAFQGCKALREITFPHDLDQIGEEAFADCTALKKVVFNDICEKKEGSIT